MSETPSYPDQVIAFIARFDRKEYWLAHEELEDLWRQEADDFYKGLIQVAASFVHIGRDNWRGARKLMNSALGYLDGHSGTEGGFDVDGIRERCRAVLSHLDELSHGRRRSFDESLRFRMSSFFGAEVRPNAVEDVELPYRARCYDEGYRPGRIVADDEGDEG